MARIFISYSSKDRDKVNSLADDLKELGHEVWFDRELGGTGGQKWWANILEQVRNCEVFIFALTPAALDSDPCRLEYRYAHALLKPILPVMLDAVDIPSLPVELQELQFVDYRGGSSKQAINLASSLNRLPPPHPLPDPLPAEPETPLAPTARISQRLDAQSLSPNEQIELLFELELMLNDPVTRVTATNLLHRLNNRPDVTAKVTEKIKSLRIRPTQAARRGLTFSAAARRFQLTCSVIVATIMVGFVGMYVMNNSTANDPSIHATRTALGLTMAVTRITENPTGVSDAPTDTPTQVTSDECAVTRTLLVATDAKNPPFESVEKIDDVTDHIIGFDIDLLQAIASKVDLKVEFLNVPFTTIFTALPDGEYDIGISGLAITEERQKVVNFSNLYYVVEGGQPAAREYFGIAVRKDCPNLLDAINQGLAAVIADGTYAQLYNKHFDKEPPPEFRKGGEGILHTATP